MMPDFNEVKNALGLKSGVIPRKYEKFSNIFKAAIQENPNMFSMPIVPFNENVDEKGVVTGYSLKKRKVNNELKSLNNAWIIKYHVPSVGGGVVDGERPRRHSIQIEKNEKKDKKVTRRYSENASSSSKKVKKNDSGNEKKLNSRNEKKLKVVKEGEVEGEVKVIKKKKKQENQENQIPID